VYFAERSASDILQITRFRNSVFRIAQNTPSRTSEISW